MRLPKGLRLFSALLLTLTLQTSSAHAQSGLCERLFRFTTSTQNPSAMDWLKKKAVDKVLDVMAAFRGLPRYLKRSNELKQTGRYLEYSGFGEMGLAEMGISVRYNRANLAAINTGKPLIIVANHHLGIADGLALQYLAGKSRQGSPSLLFLARWIEKLLPYAVFGDEQHWGTAVPVEINTPKESDPLFEAKIAEVKAFNSSWSRTSSRALKNGSALVIFPAGHVASLEGDGVYPESVYDAPNSWQEGFLNFARIGKADIVFAHVAGVNSEAFYRDRKRFGGGDKERIVWFFSEALGKKGQAIDVELSKPMNLDEVYASLAQKYAHTSDELKTDPRLTAELMRRFTYDVSDVFPQDLDATDSPQKK